MTISSKMGTGQRAIRMPDWRDDVLGLASLLRIGKASAESSLAGTRCVALLDEAVTGLLERNGLARDEINWPLTEDQLMPLPTLLRALEYARAEAVEPLNDEVLAQTLTQCIGLIQAHRFQANVPDLPAAPLYN